MGLRDDSRDYVFLSGDADPRLIENLRLTQEIADLRAKLEQALADCVDSLEYVNRMHPEATGFGVRVERIQKAMKLLKPRSHE